MSIKTPRLIRDRCGVYYFRLIVPLALRDSIGKTELRRSLRTKEADIARHRALILSAHMEAVMVDPRFLTNPSIADFPHLLKPGAKRDIREKSGSTWSAASSRPTPPKKLKRRCR